MLERAEFWRPLYEWLEQVHALFEQTPGTDWVGKPKIELIREDTPHSIVVEVCAHGDVDASRSAYVRCVQALIQRLDATSYTLDITLLVSMT